MKAITEGDSHSKSLDVGHSLSCVIQGWADRLEVNKGQLDQPAWGGRDCQV